MSQPRTLGLGHSPSWPGSFVHLALGGALLKECGVWGSLDAACLEGMHSWRVKLEKAVTLPAIQPQLAGVCLHKDLLVTIWGRFLVEYDGEVMVCRMEVVRFHGDLCC